jgi:molybdopterin synthase catalytic subunit
MVMSWPSFRRSVVAEVGYLVRERIDTAALLDAVSGPLLGGAVVFCGTVRAGPEDGPVVAIEYSAYDEMAEAECARIEAEVDTGWPGVAVALRHRLGRVPIGEASIVIAVAAPHRAEAFEVCRYLIDEVKVRLPIWKREFLDDGEARWRSNAPTTREC